MSNLFKHIRLYFLLCLCLMIVFQLVSCANTVSENPSSDTDGVNASVLSGNHSNDLTSAEEITTFSLDTSAYLNPELDLGTDYFSTVDSNGYAPMDSLFQYYAAGKYQTDFSDLTPVPYEDLKIRTFQRCFFNEHAGYSTYELEKINKKFPLQKILPISESGFFAVFSVSLENVEPYYCYMYFRRFTKTDESGNQKERWEANGETYFLRGEQSFSEFSDWKPGRVLSQEDQQKLVLQHPAHYTEFVKSQNPDTPDAYDTVYRFADVFLLKEGVWMIEYTIPEEEMGIHFTTFFPSAYTLVSSKLYPYGSGKITDPEFKCFTEVVFLNNKILPVFPDT